MRKMNNKTLVMAALMAAVLAGCGGGGGGDDKGAGNTGNPGNPSTPTTPENTTGPDLQNSVPAPTYAAGSQEQDAWNVLQQARQACGFGMLQQDTRLDASSGAHANYINLNKVTGHSEVQGFSGFTGVTPQDRAKAHGFPGQVGENVSYNIPAKNSAIQLLTVPYHAISLISMARYVGISKAVIDGGYNPLVLTLGYMGGDQKIGAGKVANYPCEGAANVAASWRGENPDAFPDLEYKGTSIFLQADSGSSLVIVNLSITRVSTGELLPYRTITRDNDPHKYFQSHEYVAVPIAPLVVGETYNVTYSGTLNGKSVGKTFTFKPSVRI